MGGRIYTEGVRVGWGRQQRGVGKQSQWKEEQKRLTQQWVVMYLRRVIGI
jgi:hypothetical protein